jgi:hypothetical protein
MQTMRRFFKLTVEADFNAVSAYCYLQALYRKAMCRKMLGETVEATEDFEVN